MKVGILTLAVLLAMLVGLVACGTPAPPPTPTPRPPSSSFDLEKLIVDVFDPQPGEKVVVMTDLPHGDLDNYAGWLERREDEWCHALPRRLCAVALCSSYRTMDRRM